MARVSLIDEHSHPGLDKLIAKIRGGRGGRLLNIYKMLLHSPALAEKWLDQVSAVRWQTDLDGRIRELVIIRIGLLNRVDYVIRAHVPAFAVREGLTIEQCAALKDWQASSLFDDRQRAALAYADAMTRDVQVPDTVFAALKDCFSEKQIVELTVLIGTYNMHTRVLQALEIDPEAQVAAK
jgi:4-carboxymuconolactone decarboxylase